MNLKFEFPVSFAEALEGTIAELAGYNYTDDDDKLVIATLVQLKDRLHMRLYRKVGKSFQITLHPTEALALRLLYTGWFEGGTNDFVSNQLRMIADKVHQQLSNPTSKPAMK